MARTELVLGVLLTVLALAIGGLLVAKSTAPDLLPSSWTQPQRDLDREQAVTDAARAAAVAFLDVDYRDMQPRVRRMLSLSTGAFREQYQQRRQDLIDSARSGKAISTGTVRQVGLSELGTDTAVVLVAAESTFTNTAAQQARKAGQQVDETRRYRFQLTFTEVGGRWLLSDLQIVA